MKGWGLFYTENEVGIQQGADRRVRASLHPANTHKHTRTDYKQCWKHSWLDENILYINTHLRCIMSCILCVWMYVGKRMRATFMFIFCVCVCWQRLEAGRWSELSLSPPWVPQLTLWLSLHPPSLQLHLQGLPTRVKPHQNISRLGTELHHLLLAWSRTCRAFFDKNRTLSCFLFFHLICTRIEG